MPPIIPQDPQADIRIPVYVRIQRAIRQGVAAGQYRPGDRIPSEPALASRFGTTRATVARALQELVFDGTIVRRPGAGSFVAVRRDAVALDARRLRSFEEQADESGQTVSYQLIAFQQAEMAGGGPVYHLERVRLVDGVKLGLESRFIPLDLGQLITAEDLATRALHDILENRVGLRISRIEASVLAGVATHRIARLLGLPRGRPLLIRDHRLIGEDERLLAQGRSFYTEAFRLDYVVHQGPRP